MESLDTLCVNTLRFLAVDAVERAKSGHPGMPLGAAPMAYVLWDRFLRHSPSNPSWFNRDRFILSAGHGSALLYALLHVTGYDLPLEELKRFRQWGSMTPGHPERGLAPGIEATTGPLGQGFAMGVGMAVAERFLAATYNRPGIPLVDHHTYAIVSDGDLMEGVSSEAASLAGTLGLGNLIYFYDDNGVSIEGDTDLVFREDVAARFDAYGWHVQKVEDGNDLDSIERAIRRARSETAKPSLIIVATHLGYGSPKQDKADAHGEPLGADATRKTKQTLGWPPEPDFVVPDEALGHFRLAVERGRGLEAEWNRMLDDYGNRYPDAAREFRDGQAGRLPDGWDSEIPVFHPDQGPIATREASALVMAALAKRLKNLIGGSADLGPSTRTILKGFDHFSRENAQGRNLHFGVREFAMAAMVNGMALHSGVLPYASTFLVFSDYMRPALRFAAMMQAPAIFVFSHDSIALGEDGPTHQPVEHLVSLRAIPGLTVLRPADANETALCWRVAIRRRRPAALVLARQKVPVLDCSRYPVADGAERGAYALTAPDSCRPEIVLVATGSEVHIALKAADMLAARRMRASVVSMPSWEIFEEQPAEYREHVLPRAVPKLAVEAGVALGWHKYVGECGSVVGLDRFGASAPGPVVYERLGFSIENVVQQAQTLIRRAGSRG